MKSATIYDVARESGFSIKTVSRVMNRDPAVTAATRGRVEAAAETLGYRPNLSARSLAGARSFVIAAFVDADLTIDHWRTGRATDYVSRLQLGAVLECRAAGYHFTLELIDHDPARLKREARDVLQALKPDGVLLTPPSCDDPEMLELLDAAGVRYARLGSDSPIEGGVQLHLGDRQGAAEVTRHLIGLGHRRIGLVAGPARHASSLERTEGFRQAMTAHSLPTPSKQMRTGDFTFRSGVAQMRALLDLPQRPTAVFACSDEMALGCLAALAEAGLECPHDVSIAGFDDSAGALFGRPELTSLRQPLVEMASEGVRRLIDPNAYRIGPAGEDHACVLVPRASTAPPRV